MEPPKGDVGLQVVERLRGALSIDREWSVDLARGIAWWPFDLKQTVVAEPPFEDDGFSISRIIIISDVVAEWRHTSAALSVLNDLALSTPICAPIVELSSRGLVRLVSFAYVHNETLDWTGSLMPTIAVAQATVAHTAADAMVGLSLGTRDSSCHPTSGPRKAPDELLLMGAKYTADLGELKFPDGAYVGGETEAALRALQRMPYCLLATGDGRGFSAEFPCPLQGTPGSYLLEVTSASVNHQFGRGARFELSIPRDALPDVSEEQAFVWLNRRTLEETSHPLPSGVGSWGRSARGLSYASFLPDAVCRPGAMLNWVISEAKRSMWFSEHVYHINWESDLEGQRTRCHARFLASLKGSLPGK